MAIETKGGTWIDVKSDDEKGHVNIYDSDPRKDHDESIHLNFDYEEGTCTINEKSNGEKTSTKCGCFLTTACMKYWSKNFDDNCYELTVLRWFRDNFVLKEDVKHYYEVAPIIIEFINKEENCNIIYDYIFDSIVDYCVEQIEFGNYLEAYKRYKSCVLTLEDYYTKSSLKEKTGKTLKLVR